MLDDRERRARQKVEREQTQASTQKMSSILSMGSTILGAVFGRKLASASNIGKATTAAKNFSKIGAQQQDVAQAQESLAAIASERADLESKFESELGVIEAQESPESLHLESFEVKPKKTDITVTQVALAWIPRRMEAE